MSGRPAGPPRFWAWFLAVLLDPSERDTALREFEDIYEARRRRFGAGKADSEFRRDVLRLVPFLMWDRLGVRASGARPMDVRGGGRVMGMMTTESVASWRAITRMPLTSALMVMVLALAAGAAGTFLLVADHVYFGSAEHVRDAGTLRRIHVGGPDEPDAMFYFSEPLRRDLAERVSGVVDVAGVFPTRMHLVREGSEPVWLEGEIVSPGYFGILGVGLPQGRGFLAEEGVPGAPHVVVIGDRVWRSAFGADPDILGRSVRLSGRPFTVVGVAPPDFRGLERPGHAEFWVPTASGFDSSNSNFDASGPDNRFTRIWQYGVARLVGDVESGTLSAALEETRAALEVDHPDDPFLRQTAFHEHAATGPAPGFRRSVRTFVGILGGAVTLLLLLALVNLAHLAAARADRRSHGLAVARALGASLGRLRLRGVLEAVVLGLAGGLVGTGVLRLLTWRLEGSRITGLGVRLDALQVGSEPALWTVVAGLALALLAALPGVLRSYRLSRPRAALAAGTRSTGDPGGAFALVGVQIALTTVLVIGAGLMARTVGNLDRVELGIPVDRLASVTLSPTAENYAAEEIRPLIERLEFVVDTLPGVLATGATWLAPYEQARAAFPVMAEGRSWAEDAVRPRFDRATAGYLAALDLPVVEGRLPRGDWEIGVVLNRALAELLFDGPAVGRRVQTSSDGAPQEVLAVVENARLSDPRTPAEPRIFTSLWNGFPITSMTLFVRTTDPPGTLTPLLRDALRGVDPSLPITDPGPLRDRVDVLLTEQRLLAEAGSMFALLALVLAAAGLYGTLTQAVTARTREIGIRTTLGASPAGLLRWVLRRGVSAILIGATVGLALAANVTDVLESRLFGVHPLDGATFVGGAIVLLAVGALASLTPALRALRVDPVEALRAD